ncbi:uncharacterized protein SPPG_07732 [Spizellomyces punctatus DAOM BR117]|uniref:Fibronectin type-III domain-containing protein n=1 Tax=Spizellomyces punctatus (strain DAOM BR117) TaxID=645134 RepID=A0A0L0H7M9_SPIPD|nr:uncharacterized protein SPPG_07732 [Spizellomyces punctatus DAOM BR117]KNC96906.1 hypothetical protein SPPG_07732 [Spizellomyces punctatus DAOM BR117]|eukprot:XP_016604946.1 hypothetical protein SPPG_07732 [Spizellomyces punctatus DAOM BR117]
MATTAPSSLPSKSTNLKHANTARKGTAAGGVLLPLNKGFTGSFMAIKAPPIQLLDPLLGRMSTASLRSVFEHEVNTCVKRVRAFHATVEKDRIAKHHVQDSDHQEKLHSSLNTRRRMLCLQLSKCWDMFGPHLSEEDLYSKMVATGEQLLGIPGFHDAADEICFTKFLKEAPEAFLTSRLATPVPSSIPHTPPQPNPSPQTLRHRAQYGHLMATYLTLRSVDPLFRSCGIFEKILDVLSSMLDVMKGSVFMEESEGAWLVWSGSVQVRTIADEVASIQYSDEIVDVLLRAISYVESCAPLLKPEYLPWRIEYYVSVYNCYIRQKAYAQAEETILEAVAKLGETATDAETAGDVEPQTQDIIDATTHRLNLLIFACEVRAIVEGKKVANADAIPQIMAAGNVVTGALKQTSGSLSGFGSIPEEDLRSSVVSQTPLRNLEKASPARGGPLFNGFAGRGRQLTSSFFDLAGSMQSITGLPSSAGPRASSASQATDGTGDLQWRPRGGGRTLVRTLSVKAISQLPGPDRVNRFPGRRRMDREGSAMTTSDAESLVAYGLGDDSKVDGGEEGDSFSETMFTDLGGKDYKAGSSKQQTSRSRKSKTGQRADDTEEGRAKRQMVFDVLYMLGSFSGDRDRFHAVVQGLHALASPDVTMTYIEKLSEDFNRNEQLAMKLLDVGFEIIISEPESFLSLSKLVSAYTTDLRLGRSPRPADVSRIMSQRRLGLLHLDDLMAYARHLFAYHQWERFSILARILDALLDTDAFNGEYTKDEQDVASKELVLRLAAINFQTVVHSERKVGFDTQRLTATTTDLRIRRLEFSSQLQTAAAGLLDALAECMDKSDLGQTMPRLIGDACQFIWHFLEPLLKDFVSISDAPKCNVLSMDSMSVILLRSLHATLTELDIDDAIFAVDVGAKLAIILECLGEFKEAVDVLDDVERRIAVARVRMGDGLDGLDSITCNVRFHKGIRINGLHDDRTSDVEVAELDNRKKDSAKPTSTCRELACAAVNISRSLFRCRMKLKHHENIVVQNKKEQEQLRLTNKHRHLSEPLTAPSEEDIKACCGENLVLTALMVAVHASEGSNLGKEQKAVLLDRSAQLLTKAQKEERRLLDKLFSADTTSHPTTQNRCPAPLFIRRTPTSITIRPQPMCDKTGRQIFPHAYQVFCRNTTSHPTGPVTVSDVFYQGSATPARPGTDITISGLTPNQSYAFACAVYDTNGRMIGGMGETCRPIVACLPLPLVLCWGQVAQIAHEAGCDRVAGLAYSILRSHFVAWDAPDASLRASEGNKTLCPPQSIDSYAEEVFKLNDEDAEETSPLIIRSFIESVYAHVDRTFADTNAIPYSDAEGTRDILGAQMLRLRSCKELLIAVELAQRIGDDRLMLLSSFKCYEILIPILRIEDVPDPTFLSFNTPLPTPMPFLIKILLTCHVIFLKCSPILGDDRAQGVRDHFAYVSFHLVRRLTSKRRSRDVALAVKVAEEALGVIHSVPGLLDTRIMSSSYLEHEWLGIGQRAAKKNMGKRKGKGPGGFSVDFAYHTVLAISSEPAKGYGEQTPRKLDAFCEYLELQITKASFPTSNAFAPASPSQQPEGSLAGIAPSVASSTVSIHRKTLDATATSLKELFSVLVHSGPDIAMENLTRFRKNPRYMELSWFAAAWCLASTLIDAAVRVCIDAEEWTERRNLSILRSDDGGEDDTRGKDAALAKRKKRSLFADKRVGFGIGKSDDKRRGRKGRTSSNVPTLRRPKSAAHTEQLEEEPAEYGTTDTVPAVRPKSEGGRRESTDHHDPRRTRSEMVHGAPATDRTLGTSRDTSVDATAKPPKSESPRSRSRSPSVQSTRTAAEGETLDNATLRRKRGAARQTYFAGLPPAELERKDRAARILDLVLSSLWRRRRFARRLRIILEYEAPWSSRLALVHGLAVFEQLQRDAQGRDFGGAVDVTLREALELRNCGRVLLNELRVPSNASEARGRTSTNARVSATEEIATKSAHSDLTRMITDALQSIVQSIVIATRVGQWLQVLESCRHLWSVQRYLLQRNIVTGTEFHRNSLWRAWWIAGTCLLDLLQGVKIRKADEEDENSSPVGLSSRPNTGRTFTYPSRPTTAAKGSDPFRGGQESSSVLPLSSLSELYGHQYLAGWIDRHGEVQVHMVDIPFIAQFSLFTIEAMHSAKKHYRMIEFGMRFDTIFKGIYGRFLRPLLATAYENLKGGTDVGKKWAAHDLDRWLGASQPTNTPLQLLLHARGLHAEFVLDRAQASIQSPTMSRTFLAAVQGYEEALRVAKSHDARNAIAMAANEYANLLFAKGDRESACLFWSKCVDAVFEREKVVADWKSLVADPSDLWTNRTPSKPRILSLVGGVKNSILAGVAVTKMVQCSYISTNLDKRQSLVLLAAHLFSAPLQGTIPHPGTPPSFASYLPPYVYPSLDLFSDLYRCDSWELAESLCFVAGDLTAADRPGEAVPLTSFIEFIAVNKCKSSPLLAFARLLKAEALVSMGCIADGIESFFSVSCGRALVPDDRRIYTPTSGGGIVLPVSDIQFEDSVYVLDSPNNIKILRNMADHALTERLGWFYGTDVVREYELCRCRLLIKILQIADVADPEVVNRKLAMLLHQEEVSQSEQGGQSNPVGVGPQKPLTSDATRGSVIGETLSRMPSHSSNISVASRGGRHSSATTSISRTQRREPSVLLGSILERVDHIMGKLISELQAELQSTNERTATESCAEMILRCFEIGGEANMLRWNLDIAAKGFASIVSTIEDLQAQSGTTDMVHPPHRPKTPSRNIQSMGFTLNVVFYFQALQQLTEALLAQGMFAMAAEYARKGLEEAKKRHYARFALIFHGLAIICERHTDTSPIAKSVPHDPEIWVQRIEQFESILKEASNRACHEGVLARGWEILGDTMRSVGTADETRIFEIYDLAGRYVDKAFSISTSRCLSGYDALAPAMVSINLKRALAAWRMKKSDPSASLAILDTTALAVRHIVHLTPKIAVPFALSRATACAANRYIYRSDSSAYQEAWSTAGAQLISVISGLVADGYDLAGITRGLCGLAGLYFERIQNEDDGTVEFFASLAHQAAKSYDMRGEMLESVRLEGRSKLKSQEIGSLVIKEVDQWKAMTEGNMATDDVTGSENLLKLQSGAQLIGTSATSISQAQKWKSDVLMDCLCALARERSAVEYPPSDAWEIAVVARIRRLHSCLIDAVGPPYTLQRCVTESVIPKLELPISPNIGSPSLPDDVGSLIWMGVPPSTFNHDGASPGDESITAILVHASKSPRRSTKGKKGSPRSSTTSAVSRGSLSSRGSSTMSANSYEMPPLVVYVARIPHNKLQAVRDVAEKMTMILEMGDDSDFGDEVQDIWESLLGNIKTCFGVIDEDLDPPPFSPSNLTLLLNLFSVDQSTFPLTAQGTSVRLSSSPAASVFLQWLARLAAYSQGRLTVRHSSPSRSITTAGTTDSTQSESPLPTPPEKDQRRRPS